MIIAFIAFTVFSVHFCECWLKSGFFGTRRVSGRMQWRLQCSRTFSGRFIIVFSPFVSQPILLFYFNQFCVLSGHIDMVWYKKEAFSIENIRITLSWNKRILQIHRMRCWKINKIIWPCKCFNALQNSFVSLHWRMVRQRIETYFAYFFSLFTLRMIISTGFRYTNTRLYTWNVQIFVELRRLHNFNDFLPESLLSRRHKECSNEEIKKYHTNRGKKKTPNHHSKRFFRLAIESKRECVALKSQQVFQCEGDKCHWSSFLLCKGDRIENVASQQKSTVK